MNKFQEIIKKIKSYIDSLNGSVISLVMFVASVLTILFIITKMIAQYSVDIAIIWVCSWIACICILYRNNQ